jgi:hypothetical protein
MKLIEPFKPDVKEALKKILKEHDQFVGVIVLGLYKDGTQYCLSSSMTHSQKCFLKCFFDGFILDWFNHDPD